MKKYAELTVVFALLIAADLFLGGRLLAQEFNLFYLVTVLFALRYGLLPGYAAFAAALAYQVVMTFSAGQDVFLLFYAPDHVWRLVFFAVLTTAAGLFSSSFKERYESIHYRSEEIREENEYLNDTVRLLEQSQKQLRAKVLESEYSLPRFFEVGLTLDQPHPELIRSEAVRVFNNVFQTGEVAIYHVDRSGKSLRLLIRKKTQTEFPQTFWLDHAPSIFRRFFEKPAITLRTIEDDEDSPLLVAPVMVHGHLSEVVVVRSLPFEKLTAFDLQIFDTVLKWIATRYEKARLIQQKENKEKFLPGTTIYNKQAFDELLAIQKTRLDELGQPYVILTFQSSELRGLSLIEFELIIHSLIREIDLVGFDEEKEEVLLLLPGTSPENESIIYNRIDRVLQLKGRVS